MRKPLLVVAIVGISAILAMPTHSLAATFAVGDVFASVNNGLVRQFSSAGVLKDTLNAGGSGFTTGSASDAAGNFYVTNFSQNAVYKFTNGGSNTGTLWISSAQMPGTASAESILFDMAGNAYVGHADGNGDITKHTSAGGAAIASFNVGVGPRGSDWIDLAADQTTMFYTSEGTNIRRFDLATNTQLTDFTAGAGTGAPKYALRILSDGGVLVADQNTGVRRFNSAGVLVQTYTVAGVVGWFSLNLDPDGTSVWSGSFSNGNLYKFDIATGALLQTINTGAGSGNLFGVSIFGEITQGGGAPIPEPSTILLLGAGLGGMIAFRKRIVRRKS
jgi:hypothetical protein